MALMPLREAVNCTPQGEDGEGMKRTTNTAHAHPGISPPSDAATTSSGNLTLAIPAMLGAAELPIGVGASDPRPLPSGRSLPQRVRWAERVSDLSYRPARSRLAFSK